MRLKLVTLSGTMFDEEIYAAVIPTVDGEIAVFPDHEPLITLAKDGVIAVRKENISPAEDDDFFAISGGVVEINPGEIKVLVDEADRGDDIVEAESQAALERALKLRDEAKDQVELEKAHQLVDRHMVRLKVADLRRRRRS